MNAYTHYAYVLIHIRRSCEYALCRLLCTRPSLDIADIFKTKFSDVTNTPECGPNSLIGEATWAVQFFFEKKIKWELHGGFAQWNILGIDIWEFFVCTSDIWEFAPENIWFDLKASSSFREDAVAIEAAAEPGMLCYVILLLCYIILYYV